MGNRKVPAPLVQTGDRLGNQAQDVARELARQWGLFPLSGAKLIDAEVGKPARTGLVFVAGTARAIQHGLGRKAIGFLEVYGADAVSAARVGLFTTVAAAGTSSLTHVNVTPTSSGTCFLLVF